MDLDWRPLFPLESPRHEQAQALDFITQTFVKNEKHFVVAELGTGVGKSAIAITLARWMQQYNEELREKEVITSSFPQTYILTSQKTLQDQYVREFKIADLRSAMNFECGGVENQQTCAETMRLQRVFKGKKCLEVINCGVDEGTVSCGYRTAKKLFKNSPIGVTNYSYLLSETVYAGGLGPRDLIVFDEAHNIESEVRRWATITIEEGFAKKELGLELPKVRTEVAKWITDQYAVGIARLIGDNLSTIEKNLIEGKVSRKLKELTHRYEMLDKHICQVNRFIEEKGASQDDYFIMVNDDQVVLKPLNIVRQARGLLYSKGHKRLLMSATILDKDVFFKSAGLPLDQVEFISIPTPFAPKSFGLTYRPTGKMTKRHIEKTLPNMVNVIKQVMKKHPNDKGIIHTHSYDITRAISQIKDKRLLIQGSSADREEMLHRHTSSDAPTIIVSPSMIEGLDLHDELGRFQVICKVPYPYMGDLVTRLKMMKDPKWYGWKTVLALVQAIGRGVRHQSDWTKTYILDESFMTLLKKHSEMFPDYFNALDIDR